MHNVVVWNPFGFVDVGRSPFRFLIWLGIEREPVLIIKTLDL